MLIASSSQTRSSIEFPKLVLLLTFLLQVVVVDQIRCVVRFKAGEVSSLVLSDDFARRDFFRESVSMIWDQAVESLTVKLSLPHPNLLLAVGAKFKVHALMQSIAAVREETETPSALFLARQGSVADVDVPQVVPAALVVAIIRIRWVKAHPGIPVLGRVGDAESDGLTVIEGQHLKVR